MILDLQCEQHSQTNILGPSNPHSLSVVVGGLGVGCVRVGWVQEAQGSGSLLYTSSAFTPAIGSSLPLPGFSSFI